MGERGDISTLAFSIHCAVFRPNETKVSVLWITKGYFFGASDKFILKKSNLKPFIGQLIYLL